MGKGKGRGKGVTEPGTAVYTNSFLQEMLKAEMDTRAENSIIWDKATVCIHRTCWM